ncbi:hypothetical protein CLU79DRAFT_733216 [Phycomyces nitens]|nr:hypothetical protein CLU79DRAFT_733216 [Phycomyces nitens]
MKPIHFYDLSIPVFDDKPWSPNTYKTRLSLNIKKLPYETVWVNIPEIYTVIPEITKTGEAPTVPIIVDTENDKVIQDSFKIAKYLETTYPTTPSLFHGDEKLHQSLQEKYDSRLFFLLFCLSLLAISRECGDEKLQAEFRRKKEEKYGVTLEEFAGSTEDRLKEINEILKDTRKTLKASPYLTGTKVGWVDAVLASQFKMVDMLNHDVFESGILDNDGDKALREWYERMAQYA